VYRLYAMQTWPSLYWTSAIRRRYSVRTVALFFWGFWRPAGRLCACSSHTPAILLLCVVRSVVVRRSFSPTCVRQQPCSRLKVEKAWAQAGLFLPSTARKKNKARFSDEPVRVRNVFEAWPCSSLLVGACFSSLFESFPFSSSRVCRLHHTTRRRPPSTLVVHAHRWKHRCWYKTLFLSPASGGWGSFFRRRLVLTLKTWTERRSAVAFAQRSERRERGWRRASATRERSLVSSDKGLLSRQTNSKLASQVERDGDGACLREVVLPPCWTASPASDNECLRPTPLSSPEGTVICEKQRHGEHTATTLGVKRF